MTALAIDAQTKGDARAPGALSVRVTFLCFLIVMVDGYDSLVASFIAPAISAQPISARSPVRCRWVRCPIGSGASRC